MKISNLDPKNVNSRLYDQVDLILESLEDDSYQITLKERVAALVAIGRIQIIFMGLRKENRDEPNAGSAVRKYAGSFKANAASGGKKGTRPAKTATVRHTDAATAELLDFGDDDDPE